MVLTCKEIRKVVYYICCLLEVLECIQSEMGSGFKVSISHGHWWYYRF